LNHLQEVVLIDMKGSESEVVIVKRLPSWAMKLKRLRIIYRSTTVTKAMEVCQMLLSFAMPETHVTKNFHVKSKSCTFLR
jgi:hypothetical protein